MWFSLVPLSSGPKIEDFFFSCKRNDSQANRLPFLFLWILRERKWREGKQKKRLEFQPWENEKQKENQPM